MATTTAQPSQTVVLPHPEAQNPNYLPIFPEFGTLATKLDSVARRIPWWFWVGGTLAAVWYMQKRGKRGKIVHLDD